MEEKGLEEDEEEGMEEDKEEEEEEEEGAVSQVGVVLEIVEKEDIIAVEPKEGTTEVLELDSGIELD